MPMQIVVHLGLAAGIVASCSDRDSFVISDPTNLSAEPEAATELPSGDGDWRWIENEHDITIESSAISIFYEPSLGVRWSSNHGSGSGELTSATLTFEEVVLEVQFDSDPDYDSGTSKLRLIKWVMDDSSRIIATQLSKGEILTATLEFFDEVRGNLTVSQRFVVVSEHGFHL